MHPQGKDLFSLINAAQVIRYKMLSHSRSTRIPVLQPTYECGLVSPFAFWKESKNYEMVIL